MVWGSMDLMNGYADKLNTGDMLGAFSRFASSVMPRVLARVPVKIWAGNGSGEVSAEAGSSRQFVRQLERVNDLDNLRYAPGILEVNTWKSNIEKSSEQYKSAVTRAARKIRDLFGLSYLQSIETAEYMQSFTLKSVIDGTDIKDLGLVGDLVKIFSVLGRYKVVRALVSIFGEWRGVAFLQRLRQWFKVFHLDYLLIVLRWSRRILIFRVPRPPDLLPLPPSAPLAPPA